MTTRQTTLLLIGFLLIGFTWLNAEISRNVSSYQLDAAYHCNMNPAAQCKNDVFGSRIILK